MKYSKSVVTKAAATMFAVTPDKIGSAKGRYPALPASRPGRQPEI
jgi:hypothetical protein